jgi:hypothetical protein
VRGDRRGGDAGEHAEVGSRTGDQLGVVHLQGGGLAEPAEGGAQPYQPAVGEVSPLVRGVGEGLDGQWLVRGDEHARRGR